MNFFYGFVESAKRFLAGPPFAGPAAKKRRTSDCATEASEIKADFAAPARPMKRSAVFTSGQGDVGQLGHGEDVLELTKFRFVKDLGCRIVDACAGGMHTVALDNRGEVWSFGCNDEGALGRVTTDAGEEFTPGRISLPRPAVAITAGDSHSAALLDNGHVYAWGSFRDSHGSIGLCLTSGKGRVSLSPVQITGKPATAIASGNDHLVILTTSRTVITLGAGEQGQLGRIPERSASRKSRRGLASFLTPAGVRLRNGASRIWAGFHATFALDTTGQMYAWGLNNYGQLGVSTDAPAVLYQPRQCVAFNVSRGWNIACGLHHTLAVDGGGKAYALGRHDYGRLGLGPRENKGGDAVTLEPIRSLGACASIAAGTSNSIAVTKSGEAYAWGMGSEGLLGTGRTSDECSPARCAVTAPPSQCLKVSAGGQHTVLLVKIKK